MAHDSQTAVTYSRWAMSEGRMSVTEYNQLPIKLIKEFAILNKAKIARLEHAKNMQATGNTGKTYTFD